MYWPQNHNFTYFTYNIGYKYMYRNAFNRSNFGTLLELKLCYIDIYNRIFSLKELLKSLLKNMYTTYSDTNKIFSHFNFRIFRIL